MNHSFYIESLLLHRANCDFARREVNMCVLTKKKKKKLFYENPFLCYKRKNTKEYFIQICIFCIAHPLIISHKLTEVYSHFIKSISHYVFLYTCMGQKKNIFFTFNNLSTNKITLLCCIQIL